MKKIGIKTNGITRIVFLIGKYVIKFPNFLIQHDHFLSGCKANWGERKLWKLYRECNGMPHKDLIAPSCFCSWFGLFQIQKRVIIRDNSDHLNADELYQFRGITTDTKASNFGYYKGRMVCVDYA